MRFGTSENTFSSALLLALGLILNLGLVNALPGSPNNNGDPIEVTGDYRWQMSDTYCWHMFRLWYRARYGAVPRSDEKLTSDDAEMIGITEKEAQFNCKSMEGVLEPGEVRVRGPFIMSCNPVTDEVIELYDSTMRKEGRPFRKARCVSRTVRDNRGSLRVKAAKQEQAALVKAGMSNCLSSIRAPKNWLQLSYEAWTTSEGSPQADSESLGLHDLRTAADISWSMVGGPIEDIQHYPNSFQHIFHFSQAGVGRPYRVCAHAALGHESLKLHLRLLST